MGVVKDFHIQKFDLAIEPLYMRIRPEWTKTFGEVIMSLNTEAFEETKKYIVSVLNEAAPLVPFDVKFLKTQNSIEGCGMRRVKREKGERGKGGKGRGGPAPGPSEVLGL